MKKIRQQIVNKLFADGDGGFDFEILGTLATISDHPEVIEKLLRMHGEKYLGSGDYGDMVDSFMLLVDLLYKRLSELSD